MNDQEILFYAALFHDLGKLYQRAFPHEVKGLDERKHPQLGALLLDRLGMNKWLGQEGAHLLRTLVAHHHERDLNEWAETGKTRYLAEILSEADNLSAVEREKGDQFQEPLHPIFTRVKDVKEGVPPPKDPQWFYPYTPLKIEKESLFPKKERDGEVLLRQISQGLVRDLTSLINRSSQPRPVALFHTLEKYTWCVPSAYFGTYTDVSLFDHARTTAAIAVAMYRYLEETHPSLKGKGNKEQRRIIKNLEEKRYALLCGDISGIQAFIYRITSKGAAKGLKGRSFSVQMITRTACHLILEELKLPITQVIYLGGGRFYLLLPAHLAEEALRIVDETINPELFEKYHGSLFLAAGYETFSGKAFKDFATLWSEAEKEANKAKGKKFASLDYAMLFESPQPEETPRFCDACGAEVPSLRSYAETELCEACYEQVIIGEKLRRFSYLARADEEADFSLFGIKYKIFKDLNEVQECNGLREIYKINDTNLEELPLERADGGFLFYGGNRAPVERERIKTFSELAEESHGIKRLGILRMDVDDLGRVFSKGLGQDASLSRLASLSRMLILFFSGYINSILEPWKDNTYLIYSGGDDLFLVGSWHVVPQVAREIRQEFEEFVCHNPHLTLSGGILLASPKFPLYKAAQLAGSAEALAKDFQRPNGKKKDAFHFLSTTVGWEELEDALKIKEHLRKIKEREKEKLKPVINRLMAAAIYYKRELDKRIRRIRNKEANMKDIKQELFYMRWQWMLVYSLTRIKSKLIEGEINALRELALSEGPNRNRIEYLYLPVRWMELLERKGGESR